MSLTINLAAENVAALAAKARAKGLSLEEYAQQVLERDLAPEWLQESWETSKQAGLDQLSMDDIDAEIAAVRKAAENLGRSRADDPRRSGHQHCRLGSASTSGTAGANSSAVFSGIVAAVREWQHLRRVRRSHKPPALWPKPDTIANLLRSVREKGCWVRPTESIDACTDPDDNVFLECAAAVQAHYVVHGESQTLSCVLGGNQNCCRKMALGHHLSRARAFLTSKTRIRQVVKSAPTQ